MSLIAACQQQARRAVAPSLLFEDGFESGGITNFTGKTEESGNTFAVISTASPYAGTYHGRCTMGSSTQDCFVYKQFSELSDVWAECYLRISNWVTTGAFGSMGHLYFMDGATEVMRASIQNWKANGTFRWRLFERGSEVGSGTYTELVEDTDYRVTIHFVADSGGGDGVAALYIDGVAKFNKTDVSGTSAIAVDEARFGVGDHAAGTVDSGVAYIDNVKIDGSSLI